MSTEYGAPSLYDMAKRACIKSINFLTDVADLPYDLVKPVLAKIQTAKQLASRQQPTIAQIEGNSPHIRGLDEELWLKFIERDIPNWRSKLQRPKSAKGWYNEYLRLIEENKKEVEADAAIMEAAIKGIEAEKAKRTSKFVDSKNVPRLPRMGGMRVDRSSSSGGGGGVPKPTSILERARRDAKEMSRFSHQNAVLARPTHKLSQQASPIRRVPQSIINDHKMHSPSSTILPRAAQPRKSGAAAISPKPLPAPKSANTTPNSTTIRCEERKRKSEALDDEGDEIPSTSSARPPTKKRPELSSPSTEPDAQHEDKISPFKPALPRTSRKIQTPPLDLKPKVVGRPKPQVDIFMPAKKRKVVR